MNKISKKKIKEIIQDLKNFGSLNNSKHNSNYYYKARTNVLESDHSDELKQEFLDVYNQCKSLRTEIETDDRAVTNTERDSENKIKYYTFEIYRRDSPALVGKLDRKEMESIYRLYSLYGANLTQKIVSREFPQYTFIEFKRILRAFNIYKASSEFPLHMIEELSEDKLIELHNQNKENNVLRRIEKDQLSEANKLINKLTNENLKLKTQLEDLSDININFENFNSDYKPNFKESEKSLILHLSDLHIGSKCESNTLYPNKWDKEELERRLDVIIDKISSFGYLDTLIINLLGDNLDGMDNQTARRDHFMPQNMDNMEQVSVFIQTISAFILKARNLANKIKVYSVKCGNHDGIFGYTATLALINLVQNLDSNIDCTLFKDFIGSYEFKSHTYLLCHGKDEKFMKKPFPTNLNDNTQIKIYEWLEANNITGTNIHFIKGDLHSNALNSCRKFDYRNVLSLYGASDYSNFNYSRNSYGVSYDLFIGDVRTIGTFENF